MKENCQSDKTESKTEKRKDHLFKKGVSGNIHGRPKNSKNRVTVIAESLLRNETESIVRKLIDKAKQGNLVAIKLILDRIYPCKEQPIHFTVPKIENAKGLLEASNFILQAVSQSEITVSDAEKLTKILASHAEHYERLDLLNRIDALEEKNNQ
jgi:hypothetical protein